MKKLTTLVALCLVFASTVWSQSIFTNPITGTDPGLTNPYTTGQVVNPNITAGGIGRGSGVAGAAATNRYNATGWNSASLDVNDYFTFTLTPNAGQQIDFISFVYTGQASGTGPTSFAFRSSVDGFTANIGTPTATGATISLSGAAYQGITTAIEFRLYAWGASNAAGTFSVNDFTFNANLPLPIELINFNVKKIASSASISFSTASERNNAYFSIERSTDGARYEAIGRVTGAGNSSVQRDYTFTDERPVKGVNFYRLQQVDTDGKFAYSPVVSVTVGELSGVRLSPLPVTDQLQVALEEPVAAEATWQVYDFSGRLLQSGVLPAESNQFEINTTTLTEGSYVLRLVSGQQITTRQFQKR